MELTAGHAIQGLMLISTIAGGYAVVKSQLARVIEDLDKITKELEGLNTRLDQAEAKTYLFEHQLTVLGGILSPDHLREQHRELAQLQARLAVAEKQIEASARMHNGEHPPVVAK